MAAPKQDEKVVMGSAIGLEAAEVAPFLRSVRKCGYTGDVVLFVDRRLARNLQRETRATHGVKLVVVRSALPVSFRRMRRSWIMTRLWAAFQIPAWTILRLLDRVPLPEGSRLRVQTAIAQLVCTPMEARFLHFRSYLDLHFYDRILMSDVRDVLFQSDPFRNLPPDGLGISVETRRYQVGTESLNAGWIAMAYGPDVLARIGANPVSCVGVTCGDRAGSASYLEAMRREIFRLSAAAARRGGADTAIHNVLAWTGRLGRVHLLETLGSPVATLNGVPANQLVLTPAARILNRDGSEPSVVHQYDRLPGLAAVLVRSLS
jgi:hypothetical protein